MSETYDFSTIEQKYKKLWFDNNIYKAEDFSPKPKKYILAELPYPSGKYLHVGHMMRYTVPEIYSRYLRMNGYNVLFPMGWDCFGLPAETFAIKEQKTPQEVIAQAMVDYKAAMQGMGYAFDWDREINTSDPAYYKWTQWMFLQLYSKGLAELKELPVWWCEQLGVLADEEVLAGPNGTKISERGGYPVHRRLYKQWVLKITNYTQRLLDDLALVDYKDSVKQAQINWIGKTEGAKITWQLGTTTIETFTTRPETIYGVTFLAISPEHPAIPHLSQAAQNKTELLTYIDKVKSMSDLERQTKEKTGVQIKGISAIHPLTANNIPVFIGDYVMLDYGTGAVMGVPGHDPRDFAFATKYGLEVIKVIESATTKEVMINSGPYTGQLLKEFQKNVYTVLESEKVGGKATIFKLRDQIFSRQRYWGEPIPLVYKQNGQTEPVSETELPVVLPVMQNFLPDETGTSPLAQNVAWKTTKDTQGNPAVRETQTMPTWAGSNWYFIRYLDPKNTKTFADVDLMKYWLPVDLYFGDAGHNTAHLLYSRFWFKALHDMGHIPYAEPYKYRMSGGILLGEDGRKMSKSKGNTIDPKVVLENYGADAARTYLAFIGPYEDTYPWKDTGIKSMYRLVKTIHDLKVKVGPEPVDKTSELYKSLHKLIKNVTIMFESFKINTAVAQIMIFVTDLKATHQIPTAIWKDFVLVIAPFMPFLAEELWQELNDYAAWQNEHSVHLQPWPKPDESALVVATITIPVQVNGKVKAQVELPFDCDQEEAKLKALAEPKLATYLAKTKVTVQSTVFVKNKILNLITN